MDGKAPYERNSAQIAHTVERGLGLRVAIGEYVGVVTNDSRVVEGDAYDLCVPGTIASPLALEKPGVEPGRSGAGCLCRPIRT
jgi:hypothetical protein